MTPPPDDDPLAAAERALESLLRALGAPVDSDPELAETPQRAARALRDELLDGYRADPAAILREATAARDPGPVVLANVRYVSVCPHHLLPSMGRAHVGYLPGERVTGLGVLVRVLEAYAHRLILQETLGQRVADALVEHLGARAAGVMLRARHQCLAARGERQADSTVVTVAVAGLWADGEAGRAAFLGLVPGAARRLRARSGGA